MADNHEPVFQIQRVYLKDMSLEQPNSPGILLSQETPSVDIQIGIGSAQIGEHAPRRRWTWLWQTEHRPTPMSSAAFQLHGSGTPTCPMPSTPPQAHTGERSKPDEQAPISAQSLGS